MKSKVNVRYFASLREIVGKREETLEVDKGFTVKKLLLHLSSKYGNSFREYIYRSDIGELRDNLQFLIDGKSIKTLNGIETKLHEGCQFAIIPPVGGGCAIGYFLIHR